MFTAFVYPITIPGFSANSDLVQIPLEFYREFYKIQNVNIPEEYLKVLLSSQNSYAKAKPSVKENHSICEALKKPVTSWIR